MAFPFPSYRYYHRPTGFLTFYVPDESGQVIYKVTVHYTPNGIVIEKTVHAFVGSWAVSPTSDY